MSLFHPRGGEPGTPADRPVTKLTVRLPKAMPEARIVAVHGSYGDTVRKGAPVLSLRTGEDRHVLNAPREGRLLPLVGPGDEVRAGDALFALHFESDAGDVPQPPHDPAGPSPPDRKLDPGEWLPRSEGETSGPRPRRTVPVSPRGRHVPVLGEQKPPAPRRPAPKPPTRAPIEDPERIREHVTRPARPRPKLTLPTPRPARIMGELARIVLAAGLLLAGVLIALPLVVELGFGGPENARLLVTIAALALGLLVWRLLAWRAGPIARLGVGIAGICWTALVILTMTGFNPIPLGPVSLPDTHALAPASRIRVPPARPAAAPPPAFSGVRSERSAGSAGPALVVPEREVAFTALPVERFALGPTPSRPPAVNADADIPTLSAPGVAEALPKPSEGAGGIPAVPDANPELVEPADPHPAEFDSATAMIRPPLPRVHSAAPKVLDYPSEAQPVQPADGLSGVSAPGEVSGPEMISEETAQPVAAIHPRLPVAAARPASRPGVPEIDSDSSVPAQSSLSRPDAATAPARPEGPLEASPPPTAPPRPGPQD